MGRYRATLKGESDEWTVTKEFSSLADAKAWLLGEGLAEFDDQEATGDIVDPAGELVFMKPHLQTVEQEERETMRWWYKVQTAWGRPFKPLKPMKRR